MNIKLGKKEIIHFIGIGGIGMSGLAIIMNGLGFKVKGSDISASKNTQRLVSKKIKVLIGHKQKYIENSTIVVVSSAIKKNNPEYVEAKRKKLPIYKRGEMLGHIVSLMKNIVVAGSHGKTTTTSLISSIFFSSKIDPTIINGGILNSNGNSARLGKSNWCILEADESDGSFLNIPVTYSIITNIDYEHLDFYKSISNIKKSFADFLANTPSFGKCYICIDDNLNKELINNTKNKNIVTYGVDSKANFQIKNIVQTKFYSQFDLAIKSPGNKINTIKKIRIPIIGIHNIKNATAAIAVSYNIGISVKMIKNGLKNFQGVERRFNHIFNFQNSKFIDDYAHHPTEINSVLSAIRKVYSDYNIYCIFQPHRVSRLNLLRDKFTKCFKDADYLILCPVYKAGENLKINFEYENFAREITKNSKVKTIMINGENDLSKFAKQNIFGNNIVIGVGAGTISSWMRNLQHKLL